MKLKRITALVLAIVMTIGMFPVYTSAQEGASTAPTVTEESVPETTMSAAVVNETTPETTTAPTIKPEAKAAPQDNCPYCEDTTAEDGTVIHGVGCTAAYVYDGAADVGRYVQLIPAVAEAGVVVSGDPTSDPDGISFFYDEFGANTVMRITEWYWDAGTTGLWYRVELHSGAFPESTADYSWPATPWILQDYTDTTYDWDAVLEFVTLPEEPEPDETEPAETKPEEFQSAQLQKTTEKGNQVGIRGMMPVGVTMSVQDVTVNAADYGIADAGSILAALDIRLLAEDGTSWQPYADEREVEVTIDAAKLGLSDGDVVTLHHNHEGTITKYDPYVVIGGKLTFWTDNFSIFLVTSTAETSGDQIAANSTYTMTVGDEGIFYSPGYINNQYENNSEYQKYFVWTVTDTDGAINYEVTNMNDNHIGVSGSGTYDARVAPWISVVAKKSGTVTLKMTTYYQRWLTSNPNHPDAVILSGEETFTIQVNNPDNFHIENKIAETGCLIPKAPTEGIWYVTYTWTRSDGQHIRAEALDAATGGINVSIDRGGVTNGRDPITYTVTARDITGKVVGTDSYEVLYGNEILNPSFETPEGASSNWAPPWGGQYGYVTNGTPGLYWKTTTPGTLHNLGRDIEFGGAGTPHQANPMDGKQYVELNAEGYGALYQDLLTTPGASLSWSFSHAARYGADKNQMYIVIGASENAREIVGLDEITALINAAEAADTEKKITSSGEGFSFTYNGGIYRIWYNDADSGVGVWETVSGSYYVPTSQYLTRLFFVSNPLNLNQDKTMGNLIDGVYAGEYMSVRVEYYKDDQMIDERTESDSNLSAYNTLPLAHLDEMLKTYAYAAKILVNGKPYPGTIEELKTNGLYITDYGTKPDTMTQEEDIVLQIFFEKSIINVTKEIVIDGWDQLSAAEQNAILAGGLKTAFGLYKEDGTLYRSEDVTIISISSDGKLIAQGSFSMKAEDNGKTFTVKEDMAPVIDGYVLKKLPEAQTVTLDNTDDVQAKSVSFTNNYEPKGSLKVTKMVSMAFPESTSVPPLTGFQFTLTLSDKTTTSYRCTKYASDGTINSETISAANGVIQFDLDHGAAIEIHDIMPRTEYTISETKKEYFDEPYFTYGTSKIGNGSGGTIAAGEKVDLECVNIYNLGTGSLEIAKTVKDLSFDQSAPDQRFEFTVTLNSVGLKRVTVNYIKKDNTTETSNVEVYDGEFTLYLKNGEKATINGLPEGTYYITETPVENFAASWENSSGSIVVGEVVNAKCTNTYPVNVGALRIEKTVKKEHDRDEIPANEEYTVKVDFFNRENGKEIPLTNTFGYKIYKDADEVVSSGTITSGGTLTLSDKQYAVIENVYVCEFRVTETNAVSGLENYTVVYDKSEGTAIKAGETVTVKITNTYKRHLTELTITKTGASTLDENQSFVFNVTSTSLTYGGTPVSLRVVITIPAGATSGSVTLTDMPLGSYTIAEEENWSWRYNDGSATITLGDQAAHAVTISNTRTNPYWLSGADANKNIFDGTP